MEFFERVLYIINQLWFWQMAAGIMGAMVVLAIVTTIVIEVGLRRKDNSTEKRC